MTTPPIQHTSPDTLDALWLILTGVALCVAVAVIIILANEGRDTWHAYRDRLATENARAKAATASFAATLSTHEDIAAVEAAIARGEMVTKLTTPKPIKRRRLATHAKRYGGAR